MTEFGVGHQWWYGKRYKMHLRNLFTVSLYLYIPKDDTPYKRNKKFTHFSFDIGSFGQSNTDQYFYESGEFEITSFKDLKSIQEYVKKMAILEIVEILSNELKEFQKL